MSRRGRRARAGRGRDRGRAAALALALAAAAAALGACRGRDAPPPPPAQDPVAPGSAAPAPAPGPAPDWAQRCEAALAGAPRLSPVRRLAALIDGCRPCGDWTPLLRWGVLAADGGPRTADIEAAMDACRAYCRPEARAAFLRTLEAARGKHAPRPWRELGEACREEVSAPAASLRYMSAPYFALDRIARAAAAHPRLGPLLPAIDLPLPPLSSTGGAFVLAAAPAVAPDAGPVHVTVTTTEVTVGTLPRARLGAAGVTVLAGDALYPGATVAPRALAAALDKLAPEPDARVALIAPRAMTARRLVEIVAAAGPHRLLLAVAAPGAPEGWHLPGVVPVVLAAPAAAPPAAPAAPAAPAPLRLTLGASADDALRQVKDAPAAQLAAPPAIAVEDQATVEGLAQLLGALAHRDVHAAILLRARG